MDAGALLYSMHGSPAEAAPAGMQRLSPFSREQRKPAPQLSKSPGPLQFDLKHPIPNACVWMHFESDGH
jgi:hypothetical protein